MDRILLTGATGVIGRGVLPLLVSAGHPVSAVSRSPTQQDLLRAAGATPVSMDLFDPPAVRKVVEGHEVIINLATHIPSSLFRTLLRRSCGRTTASGAMGPPSSLGPPRPRA